MNRLLYAMPGDEAIAAALAPALGATHGALELRRFPDGEAYVRLLSTPDERPVVFVCTMDRADEKILPLYFAACTARELGATRVDLVAPYLGYMRQDARFKSGEAISSTHFARWLSGWLDGLVTVDPHLHRHAALGEIYTIPNAVAPAAPAIARWIRADVRTPLIVGPDAESGQWAQQIAAAARCPFVVASKERRGDREVSVTLPDLAPFRAHTPVLIDDIVSTGRTLLVTIEQLRRAGMTAPPVCIAVHALFAGDAYAALSSAGIAAIATCNTVVHPSNAIDVVPEIAAALRRVWDMPD